MRTYNELGGTKDTGKDQNESLTGKDKKEQNDLICEIWKLLLENRNLLEFRDVKKYW